LGGSADSGFLPFSFIVMLQLLSPPRERRQ
jgi:hypothetical protein